MAKKSKGSKRVVQFKQKLLIICSCCAVGALSTVLIIDNYPFGRNTQVLGERTTSGLSDQDPKVRELLFWENFLSDHKDYFPGWVRVATLKTEMGELSAAKDALRRAAFIDPNHEDVKRLLPLLE